MSAAGERQSSLMAVRLRADRPSDKPNGDLKVIARRSRQDRDCHQFSRFKPSDGGIENPSYEVATSILRLIAEEQWPFVVRALVVLWQLGLNRAGGQLIAGGRGCIGAHLWTDLGEFACPTYSARFVRSAND